MDDAIGASRNRVIAHPRNWSRKVSICVPTYNGANYLRECLESVLSQSLVDTEVLIVDDQSTDETLEIANEFARQDDRIRVIANPERLGLAANWNRSLELARGEWIKFVFQDDLLAPRCVEAMLDRAESCSALFVCCRRDFLFEQEAPEQLRDVYVKSASEIDEFFRAENPMSPERFAVTAAERYQVNFVGEPTATLLHRSVFNDYGTFEPSLIMCCDYECWNRVASNVGVAYLPEVLATFRVHGKSTSAENAAQRSFRMELLDCFILLYQMVQSSAYEKLRNALSRERGPTFLVDLCRQQAWKALRTLEAAESQSPEAERGLRQEWDAVATLYPALEQFAAEGQSKDPRPRLRNMWSRVAWGRFVQRIRAGEAL